MRKYVVTVTETTQHSCIIEAESEMHAEAIIAHMWNDKKKLPNAKECNNVDFYVSEMIEVFRS